jgi:16S rRNA (guanine966-N2)-methyltransferase
MDIVFLDPPFQLDVIPEVIALLVEREWLAKGALVYVEQSSNIASIEMPADWKLHRSGRTGQSAYCLYATWFESVILPP